MKMSSRVPRRQRGKAWIALFAAIAATAGGAQALAPAPAAALINQGGDPCSNPEEACGENGPGGDSGSPHGDPYDSPTSIDPGEPESFVKVNSNPFESFQRVPNDPFSTPEDEDFVRHNNVDFSSVGDDVDTSDSHRRGHSHRRRSARDH